MLIIRLFLDTPTWNYQTRGMARGRPSKLVMAKEWLSEYLERSKGMRFAEEIILAGQAEGFGRTTLFLAKKDLKYRSVRHGGTEGQWLWINPFLANLPQESPAETTVKRLE